MSERNDTRIPVGICDQHIMSENEDNERKERKDSMYKEEWEKLYRHYNKHKEKRSKKD